MKKQIRIRLIHASCLFLLFTPLSIAIAAAFTLNGRLPLFLPILFLVWVLMAVAAWQRSNRSISRIYWAMMLSQFVLVFSTEIWLALQLAEILTF